MPPERMLSRLSPPAIFGKLRRVAAKTTSVALGEKLTAGPRRKVDSGEFKSASEVIRDALRGAQERDSRIEALEQPIKEGIESRPAEPFDFDEFLAEMRLNYQSAA